MNNKKTSFSTEFAGQTLTFEIGNLALQATASVLARLGDTMVLATVVEGPIREELDYFPLSVEYVERLYAGGRIKGSRWVKREGRPSDEAILIGRVIDRSIRPLFPKEYKNEVQVTVTLLSVDGENEPDIVAINAVSTALAISPIPWNGPVGAIRMGYVKAKEDEQSDYLFNPTASQNLYSELDLIVAQANNKTLMIEAGAKQVPEQIMTEAIKRAHQETEKIILFINDIVKQIGSAKASIKIDSSFHEMVKLIEKSYKGELNDLVLSLAKKESGSSEINELVEKIYNEEKMKDSSFEYDKKIINKAVEYVMFQIIRQTTLEKNQRIDGRKPNQIRPLDVKVGILPRTHGSAIFQRGLTQALTVVTLGSPRLEQLIESAEGEEAKRYIHHYSMPPYSVGETGRMGSPTRREIGHGALAERALEPVIPSKEKFPYTIRVVSEILSSNGSTSMASACGSTLALMDAGVPILNPVAGISIGMMSDKDDKTEKYVLLTDIIGLEDFSGDMDFKVAGTTDGITAIQLDVKIPGLTIEQIAETLQRAREARLEILEKMLSVIPEYRKELSEYAPKIEVLKIPVEKIGELIGSGGRTIKNIIAQTGATVDVEDDGTVTISGNEEEAVNAAVKWVEGLTREILPGEIFEGPVKRILPFGAFVEIMPGKEGMVHVSQMRRGFVKSPEEIVKVGDVVKVKVLEIDEQGRVNLSMIFGDKEKFHDQYRSGIDSYPQNEGASDIQHYEHRERFRRSDKGYAKKHPLVQQFQRERSTKKRFNR